MAAEIWGAKPLMDKNQGKTGPLLEVTRFKGIHLREIGEKIKAYLTEHPRSDRYDSVTALTQKPKEATRMQAGLDILNQLAAVGKGGDDVNSVIVRQGENPNEERGLPACYYEIDWINPPDKRQVVASASKTKKPDYPFKTQVDRRREKGSKPDTGLRRWQEQREMKAKEEEREQILEVIIDKIKEAVDDGIEGNLIRIEVIEGTAVVSCKWNFAEKMSILDRETGILKKGPSIYSEDRIFYPEAMDYINFLAQVAEGKDVARPVKPLDFQVRFSIYLRAFRAGMIRREYIPGRGTVYMFNERPDDSILSGFNEMDLEENVVRGFLGKVHPINSSFSAYLKDLISPSISS